MRATALQRHTKECGRPLFHAFKRQIQRQSRSSLLKGFPVILPIPTAWCVNGPGRLCTKRKNDVPAKHHIETASTSTVAAASSAVCVLLRAGSFRGGHPGFAFPPSRLPSLGRTHIHLGGDLVARWDIRHSRTIKTSIVCASTCITNNKERSMTKQQAHGDRPSVLRLLVFLTRIILRRRLDVLLLLLPLGPLWVPHAHDLGEVFDVFKVGVLTGDGVLAEVE